MLRSLLLVFSGALALAGVILVIRGLPAPGAYALGVGVVIVLGTAFERWRYRPGESRPGTDWQRTGERFADPETGTTVQVFYDPRTGERRYVSDPDPPNNEPPRG